MRIMKLLGCKATVITNAAGGLDPNDKVGTILAILDHVSLPSLVSTAPVFLVVLELTPYCYPRPQ